MIDELKDLLGDARPPSPPSELRNQTLRAAVETLERAPSPDRWTRIWNSRPLRFAWVVTVAGLLLAHALISSTRQSTSVAAGGFALHQVSRTTEGEIQLIATMLRLDLDANALGGRAVAIAAPRNTPEPDTSTKKETIR